MDGWAGNVKKSLNKIQLKREGNDKEVNLLFFASAMFS